MAFGLTYSSAATSRLVIPFATRTATSRSRAVSSRGDRDPGRPTVIPCEARSASTRHRNGSAPALANRSQATRSWSTAWRRLPPRAASS